jgi:cytochrome b
MIQNSIKVWDPMVRIFHWSLVVFFTTAFLTGDEESLLHTYAGYIVVGLVLFRIIWGIVGTKHARFNDFIYRPSKVIQYLKDLASGTPRHYVGHNPAGGYMVILLLATLLLVTFSGLKTYGIEGHGPLAINTEISVISSTKVATEDVDSEGDVASKEGESFWEEIHELSSNFMLALIALHILGIVVSSRLHKENLIKAMITGKKNVD